MPRRKSEKTLAVEAMKAAQKAEVAQLRTVHSAQLAALRRSFERARPVKTSYHGFAPRRSGLLGRAPAKPSHGPKIEVYRGFYAR